MRLIDADVLAEIFIDRMEKVKERFGFNSSEAGILSGAYKLLQSQPTIESEWIPVDKELPKDGMKCLVTQKFGRVRQVSKATYACDLYNVNQYDFCDKKNTVGFYYFDDEYGYVEALGVTAWMPEPEPYQGEQE